MGRLQYRKDKNGRFQAHIGRKQYLADIRGRLEDEVYPHLRLCWEIAEKRPIGFWGMIRLLMPVVEAAGKVIYPGKRHQQSSSMVLRDLRVPYPGIAWRLFRNCLLHNDELVSVIHDRSEQYAGWAISFGGGHTKEHLKVCIDVDLLYHDLLAYLQRKTERIPHKEVVELRAVRISEKEQGEDITLKKEVEELFELQRMQGNGVAVNGRGDSEAIVRSVGER